MEASLMNYSSGDYKHRIGNSSWTSGNNHLFYSFPSDNLSCFLTDGHFTGGGLYPPAVSVFRQPQSAYNNPQQPPLLPLPISMPRNFNSNNNIRLSSPRINKNVKTRGRDHSLTPKKSKNQKKDLKKSEADLNKKEAAPVTAAINEKTGPYPKDLPNDVISRVFSSPINNSCDIVANSVDKFSGSVVFTPSPPPSSLPLPTFSLRSKLSCQVEAVAGVDIGATDSLRRLLRLR